MTGLFGAAGVLAWLAVAAAAGLLLGRVIRHRDRQIPRDEP